MIIYLLDDTFNALLWRIRSGGRTGRGLKQCHRFGHDTSEALGGQGLSLDFDAAPHVPYYG